MAKTVTMQSKRRDKKAFQVEITMDKLPKNCNECPFYYMPRPENEGTWYEDWDCFVGGIDDITGIALARPKTCPLNRRKNGQTTTK